MERLRQQISIVQQEPLLFNETIRENILFGNLAANEKQINDSASRANAMAFIMQSNEDMSSPIVQSAIRDEFKTMLKKYEAKSIQFKSLSKIDHLLDTDSLSYKSIQILTLLIPCLNKEGIAEIDE